MKTTLTAMAAFAAFTMGAVAAPTVIAPTAAAEVVPAEEKTVNLELTGMV